MDIPYDVLIPCFFSVTVGRNGSGKSNFFYGKLASNDYTTQLSDIFPSVFLFSKTVSPLCFLSHPVCAQ